MKKVRDYTILFLLAVAFVMMFKYSDIVKASILDSIFLWGKSLIPSMLPVYIILDLGLNYGLLELSCRLFKNNAVILIVIALLAGTPTNAKYIREFYEEGYISKSTGNFLLMFSYSPNPLFVLAFSPNMPTALVILASIYLTNIFIFLIFAPKFEWVSSSIKTHERISFVDALSKSIMKSKDILVLILGVVIVYGVLNTYLSIFHVDSIFISSVLELTNALAIISKSGFPLFWAMFACLFGGLSIHTQIKSILEGTDLSYRYFLIGRLCAALPILLFTRLY